MSSRNRTNINKIETLIENCRSEGKWQKVIELAEELKGGSANYECLANFLIGEGRLEAYLEENPPIEANFPKAKVGLLDAKNFLNQVTGEDGRRAGIALDAHLLLAKIYYACGQYDEGLENFVLAELNTLSEKELTLRSLRILAESYAIKGICLENHVTKPSTKYKQAERDSEMINCFERATDLGLLYLQQQDGILSMTGDNLRMGAILEMALQRAPIVLIKTGKLQAAIERYRLMLNAVETKTTQSLRLTLARQLAEVLLRGVSGTVYTPPSASTTLRNQLNQKKLWKPQNYVGKNLFTPRNQSEETILLLLISETLAVHNAVLSQSPEFRAARSHALGNATAVYDLLTLATVKWGQIGMMLESFEKALKFAYGEQHVWRQYALCLVAMEHHSHALTALQESAKLVPHDPLPCLMSARICYEQLGLVEEGLKYAQEALKRDTKGLRVSRTQLYVGIGYQQMMLKSSLKAERERYQRLALESFTRAVHSDPNDHLAEYYLALQYAHVFNISEALVHVRIALTLRSEHANSLMLFALLLTADRRIKDALLVVDDAIDEFPDNLHLLHVKAHMELYLCDVETSLSTIQLMLKIWRDLYEGNNSNGLEDQERYSDTKSGLHYHSNQMSDKDSNSIHAASIITASRVEHALSDVASSLSSLTPKLGPQNAWTIQIKIWLLLADAYLTIDQSAEAMNCVQEASQIYPLSHQVMFMRGRVLVFMKQWTDAKQCFLNSVAANPFHVEALRILGEIHHILGEPRLAEKVLKDAAKIYPHCPKTWFALGQVMEALGDFGASADCMATALQLEPSCPVIQFNTIPIPFE